MCLFKLLTNVTMSFYDLTSLTCSAGTIASCSPILKLSLLRKENPGGREYSHLHIYKHWFLVHKYTHIVHAHAHICTQCHTPVACINTHHKTYVHAHVYTRTHMLITLTGYCFQHQWTWFIQEVASLYSHHSRDGWISAVLAKKSQCHISVG